MAKLEIGINDLATTHPELAAEWHPTKNNDLQPTDVSAGSGKRIWWQLPYDVPEDYPIEHLRGKHFDFEWEATVQNRANGNNCPYLTGKAVWKGFNDLATTHPHLIDEWHPTLNGDLTPEMVTAGSNKKVWWHLEHDDPDTGRHHNYQWTAKIEQRANGSQCPQIMASKGEKLVRAVLELQGIAFKEQHVFPDRVGLSGKHLLRDDFAVFDMSGKVVGTIEFHGKQHYEVIQFGGKSQTDAEERFKQTQERDKIKSDYLKAKGIKQLAISYKDVDKVQELVNGFIKDLSKDYELTPTRYKREKARQVEAWQPIREMKADKQRVDDFMNKIRHQDFKHVSTKKEKFFEQER